MEYKKSSEKLLKKPRVNIKKISSDKLLRQFGREASPLVRQVPEKEEYNEDRSLFFNKEYAKEKRIL